MEKLTPTVTERRRQTRGDIYRYIFHSLEPVSKQQIANVLNISLPTVYKNLSELEEAGLVKVGEIKGSTGGRPPVAYVAAGDIKFALGIAISANHIRMLASDLKQNVLAYHKLRLESPITSDMILHIDDRITTFLSENHLDKNRMLGVGITIPGVFDRDTGELVLSPTMKLENFHINEMKKNISYPLYFENDSTSGGNAEWVSRTLEEQKKDFVYLFLEYGVGGAIFVNGKQYYGNNHRSAEFGHMCVEANGKECNCGKYGCLEAYCSAFRFSRDLGITIEEFFEGLKYGNKEYQMIWNDALNHIAIAVNNLRMAFDCDVVLGGFLSEYLEPYQWKLKKILSELNTFEKNAEYVKIGKYPRRAGMLGVAWHFTNQFVMEI